MTTATAYRLDSKGFVLGSGSTTVVFTEETPLDAERTALASTLNGAFVVVEREDDLFLGTAQIDGQNVIIHSGLQGRPAVLSLWDIDAYKVVNALAQAVEVDASDLTPVGVTV
jgi:hypothetical protein